MSLTYRDAVAAYFKAHPGEWIDGLELARVGGAYAWRTRKSECVRDLGMSIENRQRKVGRRTVSEYRYVPASLLEMVSYRVSVPLIDGSFPKIDNVLSKPHQAHHSVVLNPAVLARVAKMLSDLGTTSARFEFPADPHGVIRIYGDHYDRRTVELAIMPMRS